MNETELIEFVVSRRWFGSKAREVTHAYVVDEAVLPVADERFAITIVEVRFAEGTHELYQLFRGGERYGALAEAAFSRQLARLIGAGGTLQAAEGAIEFHGFEGFPPPGREFSNERLMGAEQTNTSVVFDDELILKAYRRLEAGVNPELELLRFLTERGFAHVAALGGWYAYVGRPLEATLGIVQQFVPGAIDGWELALDELVRDPDSLLRKLRRLGEVTGSLHTTLASDASDPNFCPEQPSIESLGLLSATVDEEVAQVFLDLPEDVESLEPLAGRAEDIRERLRALTYAGTAGQLIRHHGDFHLGQALWAGGDWVIIDFEGEPARPLAERRRKRSPLRDVAGMLRSFAYAVSAVEILRGARAPAGWEERARSGFVEGYLTTADSALLPAGTAFENLLSVFELEKAVYELRYELNTRPDWVSIPVAGIIRLLEEPVGV